MFGDALGLPRDKAGVLLRWGPRDRKQRQKAWFLACALDVVDLEREQQFKEMRNTFIGSRLYFFYLHIWNTATISPSSEQMVGFLDSLARVISLCRFVCFSDCLV